MHCSTREMPSLLDLADEILLEILVYLELDNPTLSNICRASSRLNGLARPILYRSILFDLPPHDPILQLTRTIDGDDELASQVHGLCLTWPKDCNIPADDRVNIQNLIHKLTSLRHLVVSASLDQRSALPFLEFAEYTELRRVAFMYADLTNSMIMKFMFLPKIEKMVILFLKSLSNPSIPLACQPGTSPLKILHLDHCTPREVVLGTFLQCPKALESLTFAVPPFAEQFHTAVSTRDFSPRQVGSALMHVKHSLVNLTIYWKLSHRHDGSRLDLSSFEKLRFISLPSPLFFNIAYPHASRNGVYRVLPRSLETLEVRLIYIPPVPALSATQLDADADTPSSSR
ncbi:hypothetical protein BDZ45DRAFT_497803 [Acephala macrosclerotiorum]|nr:hypothetical protein BDZ45DRAFT_497803 [Acephala macrosclerotiorum]